MRPTTRRAPAWLMRPLLSGMMVLATALTACSHLPTEPHATPSAPSTDGSPAPAALPRLSLQGQLSVKLMAWQDLPAKGVSLGFFFTGHTDEGLLDLMTPLGSLMAQVGWKAEQAWLINQDGRQTFDNLDELSRQTLGEALPLRTLAYWMQGLPDPQQASLAGSEPGLFEQAGWLIDTRELAAQRIQAQRPASLNQRAIHIKVYLDR